MRLKVNIQRELLRGSKRVAAKCSEPKPESPTATRGSSRTLKLKTRTSSINLEHRSTQESFEQRIRVAVALSLPATPLQVLGRSELRKGLLGFDFVSPAILLDTFSTPPTSNPALRQNVELSKKQKARSRVTSAKKSKHSLESSRMRS